MTLSQRKQTAKRMLIAETWRNNRKFDNCFEMGDGDKVSQYLLDFANSLPVNEPKFEDYAEKRECGKYYISFNSPNYAKWIKDEKHYRDVKKLRLALIEGGFTWFIERLTTFENAAKTNN